MYTGKLQYMTEIEGDFIFMDSDIHEITGKSAREVATIIGRTVLGELNAQVKGLGVKITSQDYGPDFEDDHMALVHIIDQESREIIAEQWAVIVFKKS